MGENTIISQFSSPRVEKFENLIPVILGLQLVHYSKTLSQKNLSKKPKSSHDLLDDPNLLKDVGEISQKNDENFVKGDQKVVESNVSEVSVDSIRDKLKKAKPEKNSSKRKHQEDVENLDDFKPDYEPEEYEDEVSKQKRRKEEIRKEIKALKKGMCYFTKD